MLPVSLDCLLGLPLRYSLKFISIILTLFSQIISFYTVTTFVTTRPMLSSYLTLITISVISEISNVGGNFSNFKIDVSIKNMICLTRQFYCKGYVAFKRF
jgi:hypothetical protein